jgi:hypothetical protein
MSIVESEIIKVDEAFFAHALTKEGTTVYQQLTNDRKLAKRNTGVGTVSIYIK